MKHMIELYIGNAKHRNWQPSWRSRWGTMMVLTAIVGFCALHFLSLSGWLPQWSQIFSDIWFVWLGRCLPHITSILSGWVDPWSTVMFILSGWVDTWPNVMFILSGWADPRPKVMFILWDWVDRWPNLFCQAGSISDPSGMYFVRPNRHLTVCDYLIC